MALQGGGNAARVLAWHALPRSTAGKEQSLVVWSAPNRFLLPSPVILIKTKGMCCRERWSLGGSEESLYCSQHSLS